MRSLGNAGSKKAVSFAGHPLKKLLGAALVLGSANDATADVVLKVRKPEISRAVAAAPTLPESRFILKASLPLEKLASIVNGYQLSTHAKGKLAGLLSYDGLLSLGMIDLTSSGDDQFPIRVQAPFVLKGTLEGSSLNEIGQATLELRIRVEEEWCPIVELGKVSVVLEESHAKIDTRAVPDLASFIATKFLASELRNWATCDNIKKSIAQFWHPAYFNIDANSGRFLNIDPRSISFSKVTVSDGSMNFAGSVSAITRFSIKKGDTAPKSLPPTIATSVPSGQKDIGIDMLINLEAP